MKPTYDVLILGSGLGGSISACFLAQQGWRVLMIEAGTHPRFAIGEATTPDISCKLKILAHKYGVPELDYLTTFHKLRDHVSPACGIKKSFSFLYHQQDKPLNPKETHQFPTLAPPLGPDCHYFRQDTDAYMLGVAMKYGVQVRQNTRIQTFAMNQEGISLKSDRGEEFKGKFLIDASGMGSPVVKEFGLRNQPTTLKTRSRAIFTHMIGVKDVDQLGPNYRDCGLKYPFKEGTLHHMFHGGWMWVIPFDNHPDSTNPLCSVGLMLDPNIYPKMTASGEEDFFQIINRFPTIAAQFEGARAVRDWIQTDRLQYDVKQLVGDRYCLLAHAGSFVDPLFSSGLNSTLSVIDDLMTPLNQALDQDSFQAQAFIRVEQNFLENTALYDQFVSHAYRSFEAFDLWDAWFRVWVAGNFVATALNTNLYFNYLGSKDRSWFRRGKSAPYSGVLGSQYDPHGALFIQASAAMTDLEEGKLTSHEAAQTIRDLFKQAQYLPRYFRWHDPQIRATPTFTIPDATKMYLWYLFRASKTCRKYLMAWSLSGAYGYTWRSLRDHRRRVTKRRHGFFRDTFFVGG